MTEDTSTPSPTQPSAAPAAQPNTLQGRIASDLKDAMRAKDAARLRGLRAIKAALLNAATEKADVVIDAEKEMAILQKLKKQRMDALEIYEAQGRDDLAIIEREELAVLANYLPAEMGDAELETALRALIAEVGATSPAMIGKVMGIAQGRLKGQADGARISAMAKRLLMGG